MSTRDPFLTNFGIMLDRAMVWTVLTCLNFLLLWMAVWERGLGLSWVQGVRQIGAVVTGHTEPVVHTLLALTMMVAVLSTSGVCVWLFTRWRHQGELRGSHVRGPKLEG